MTAAETALLSPVDTGYAAAIAKPLCSPFVWCCNNCGDTLAICPIGVLPIPVFAAIGKAFRDQHAGCQKGKTLPPSDDRMALCAECDKPVAWHAAPCRVKTPAAGAPDHDEPWQCCTRCGADVWLGEAVAMPTGCPPQSACVDPLCPMTAKR